MFVYVITNKLDGKRYVGQSKQDPESVRKTRLSGSTRA